MTAFKIRTDVPIPRGQRGPGPKYPFADLGVGHSFLVAEPAGSPARLKTLLHRLQRACASANNRHTPARFSARVEGGGVGVWRIK